MNFNILARFKVRKLYLTNPISLRKQKSFHQPILHMVKHYLKPIDTITYNIILQKKTAKDVII